MVGILGLAWPVSGCASWLPVAILHSGWSHPEFSGRVGSQAAILVWGFNFGGGGIYNECTYLAFAWLFFPSSNDLFLPNQAGYACAHTLVHSGGPTRCAHLGSKGYTAKSPLQQSVLLYLLFCLEKEKIKRILFCVFLLL